MPQAAPSREDPQQRAKQEVTTALADAQRLLKQGDTAAVTAALGALRQSAELAGPEFEQRLFELSLQLHLKTLDTALAEKASLSWLHSCGPTNVDGCRAKALSLSRRITKPSAAFKKKLVSLKEHDACVKFSERKRRGDTPPACADAAFAFYKRDGDKLMMARLKLAAAISAASKAQDEQSAQSLRHAEQLCEQPRCLALRRSALRALMALHQQQGDVQATARVAIEDARLFATTVPKDSRLWARTQELDTACAALDGTSGPGACRKLEKAMTGGQTFRDFSLTQAGEGLAPDVVREVNAHYSPSLEPCLQQQAQRLVPPSSQSHEVRWTVGNEGRVLRVSLNRAEAHQGALGQCLRQQFLIWRYPRYRGELQHVEQVFVVHARERR